MTILITGARGKVGQAIISRLHAADLDVRAASANPAELSVPAGVQVAELTLDQPGTFEAALDGVRQVFLYPEPAGIHDFIKAAEAAGVEHIVLLSSASVLGPDAENDPLASHSLQVERALADSRLTCTLLRPDAFASNAFGWAYFVSNGLPIQLAYPEAGIAPIHTDDIADIAFEVLTGDAFKGRSITLTGAQSLTFREQIAILSEVLGRDIVVEHITRAEAEEQMSRFMPPTMVGSLLDLWAAATDTPVPVADTTETLLGKPARTFHQWASENASAFTTAR